jgi:hypothetical protein
MPRADERTACGRRTCAASFGPRTTPTILLTVHGQSVQERTGPRRAIIARLELLTEHDTYRWLNTSFVVGEGEIDEETEEWWIHAFVCVNEVAEHPPGIGQAPPEAFR